MKSTKVWAVPTAEEFERMTAELSLEARGAWVAIRMRLCAIQQCALLLTLERWAGLLRCRVEQVTTVFAEFALAPACGFRVEKPPPNGECSGSIPDLFRLCYEPTEKLCLLLSSDSVRVQEGREDKKKKEKIKIPENWILTESMQEFAVKHGMIPDTFQHEFEKCKTYHAENRWTQKGWDSLVWQRWVLNWVSYGRKQVTVATNGVAVRQALIPPFPGPEDPIGRNLWRQAYGDPANPRSR